ncbi:DNRLRE domain-containing protein [Saccharomonospora sp. NPDC046836]|uniref:DNRLRE domain-containing protein n=1 Tax=Saccharomonospora sp. NPDC046836 TaxID=3156921 RepID=UPI0033D24404
MEDEQLPSPPIVDAPVQETAVEVGEPEPEEEPAGFDSATSRELPAEGAPDLQVFANADGTKTLRAYQGRQFFRAEDGTWDKIDSTLVPDENVWRTKAESEPKQFAAVAGSDAMVSVGLGEGRTFAFGVADAEPVQGDVAGDSVTYPEVRPGADLQVQATPGGAKELIILKSADAPTVWEFPLHLQGMTASLDEGSVLLKDPEGVVQGVIPPGFMEDSKVDPLSGEGARSYGVSYELVGDAASPVLRVHVDEDWLADPERVFPVKVDPTVNRNSNGSTFVQSPFNADNSGDPNLSVGTYNGGGNKSAAYLKFDSVSSQLAGQYVLGARLWMYETWSYSCSPRAVTVHPVTQGWSVSGNKIYPGPSYGSKIGEKSFAFGHSGSCGPRWVDINLGEAGRSLVHGWTHGAANHGLTVRASTTDSYGWKKFASAASANPPYLAVTYTPYWSDYRIGAMTKMVTSTEDGTMQVTVTNRGKDTWTPSTGYELGYRIWNASGTELPYETNAAWTKMPRNVAPGQSVTVNATLKSLQPGRYRIQWDMGLRGVTRFSWNSVPMSQSVWFTIGNQTPVVGSMSPPSNFNSTTLRPTLALTGRDRDTYPGTGLQYKFKICDEKGANCTETGWQSSPRWVVPAGTLQWSKTYVWYGQVSDGQATSLWTLGAYLSTRVPQPAITSHLASTGNGVDPGVGNYSTRVTDASVTAIGPALAVTRTYNSLDPRAGLTFGSGWATQFDSRIVPDSDGSGNVVVTYPDGRQARFGRNPDGAFVAPAGEHTTLVANTGGGWTLRLKGGKRYTFDASGRLTTITDAVGRAQNLTYDNGKLSAATDATSGRSLVFTWIGGHVTSVHTDSDPALTWIYRYDGDRLVEVCDPTDACASHAYEPGSHYRTVAMDGNPRGYWRLAESEGPTAASEVPGFWGNIDGTASDVAFGQPGPLTGSPTTAAGFDGSSSYVQVPDDLVRNSAYASVELWFKTTTAGVLFSTSNYLPGAANPGGSMPVLYVGTDGKLHGHFWNSQVTGIVSPNAVNDDQWHHVVLSAAYDTQTLYLDGAAVGTQSGTLVNIDPYNFIGVGAVNDRAWPAKPAGTWSYFTGQIAEAAFYQHPLGASVVAEHYAARSASDVLTSITRPGGAVAANLTYDKADDRVTAYTDADGGTHQVSKPTVEGDGFRYGTAVRESNPNAHWRMRETEGTSADGQTVLRRGTYHRGTGSRTSGPFPTGSARSFDGAASYVQLPDDTVRGSRQMSVEMWFRTTSTAGGVLFSIADHQPGQPSSGGSMPILYVGTDASCMGISGRTPCPGSSRRTG